MKPRNSTPIDNAQAVPSGSGNSRAYSVEARLNYHDPETIGGVIFDNRWRPVPWQGVFDKLKVHPSRKFRGDLVATGLLLREEAEALRWIFICIADGERALGSICLETRIVEHQVEFSYSAMPVAYIDAFDARGDIPADMAADDAK